MNKLNTKNKIIAIIEDDDTVAELLNEVLKKDGFSTRIASDGITAIKLIKNENFDLIILDISIPGKTGFEIVKILQEDYEKRKIPVIVITGKYLDDYTKNIFQMEPNVIDFLIKPINTNMLLNKINITLKTTDIYIDKKEKEIIEEESKKIENIFPEPIQTIDNSKIRKHIRIPVDILIDIYYTDTKENIGSGAIIDLSASGVGIECDAQINIDKEIEIKIKSSHNALTFSGIVRNKRKHKGFLNRYGVKFSKVSEIEKLKLKKELLEWFNTKKSLENKSLNSY